MLTRKKSLIFFLVCLFVSPLLPQNTLTISKAIEMAHKHNPSIKAYKLNTQAIKSGEKQAMTGYHPQLTFKANEYFASHHKDLQNQQTLQASQLIYSFAGPLQEKYIAKKNTAISKYQEELQKNYIRNQVETIFLQNVLQQKKNESIKKLRITTETTFKKAKNKKVQKLIGKNEWLQEKATYKNNMATVNFYIDEVTQTEKQLEYLIGQPIFSKKRSKEKPTLIWNKTIKTNSKTLESYIDTAIKNRPEIKSSQKNIEKFQAYADLYLKKYLPSISATGQVQRNTGGINNHNVGIGLTWNLFDGALNFHKQDQAHANKLKSIMEKESNIQLVRYEVSNAYHALQKALKELNAQKQTFKQRKNEFELQKQQFKIGIISEVDLNIAKYNFEQSKINFLTYEINAANKKYNLNYTCGYAKNIERNA